MDDLVTPGMQAMRRGTAREEARRARIAKALDVLGVTITAPEPDTHVTEDGITIDTSSPGSYVATLTIRAVLDRDQVGELLAALEGRS